MFFDSWSGLARVLIVGLFAYVALVALLRISGKGTLAKLNAFDLVVTVALGSTLATVLLSKDVPLLEGILAFALLICAQYIITALSVRSVAVRRFVKSEPRLLFHNGQMLQQALRRERVTENEILAVARASGYADMAKVGAVILETDGSFDVIGVIDAVEQSSLKDVKGH